MNNGKTFKQTEIGKIPENWNIFKIKNIGTVVTGTTPKTSNTEYYGDQYKLISPADLNKGQYINTAHRMLSQKGLQQCKVLSKHSVLVGCIGNVGKIGMTIDEKSATNQQINAIVCDKNTADPHFVFYYLCHSKNRLRSAASQTTVPILNKTNFEQFKVPLPNLKEQKKIAGILSQIQKAIENQEKLIKITEELKKSIMKQLFTYGTKREKTKQTEIGEIPQNWKVCTIETLFDLKQGKSLSSKNQTGLYLKPFLRTVNVLWGHLNLKKIDEMDIPDKDRKSLLLKKEDLLVCEGGDIGRTAIWNEGLKECYYQNHIHRLRVKKDKKKDIFPRFYMYWMDVAIRKLNIYGTFGNRTTIPNLSGKRLLQFKIPLPNLKEQKKIAEILQKIDDKVQLYQQKKTHLESVFKTILNQLMTGKIRVQHLNIKTNGEKYV